MGDTAAVVVDKNGYVLYVDSAAISLGNYLFLNGYIAESGPGQQLYCQRLLHRRHCGYDYH